MEGPLALLGILAVLIFVVGPFLGTIAFFRSRRISDQNNLIRREIDDLRQRVRLLETGAPAHQPVFTPQQAPSGDTAAELVPGLQPAPAAPSEPVVTAEQTIIPAWEGAAAEPTITPTPPPIHEPMPQTARTIEDTLRAMKDLTRKPGEMSAPAPEGSAPPDSPSSVPTPPPLAARPSFEQNLGTKWLIWVGGVFMILFVAYLLKYAYDTELIGPRGRIIIGALMGIAAIVVGERFRRKNWGPLFQTLTGIGLAAFYVCIFFSYQVYHLSAAGPSFVLAIGVTVLAVALAVFHDTISIAVLAVLGGFLSPVLLSTGENHPYALFLYVATLDLVAIGAAYYRRWHALELLCFVGTSLMMVGWYQKYGGLPDQLTPALIFISAFYLIFLLIPTLHTLIRGLPDSRQGTVLLVLNALFTAVMFYRTLYPEHAHALGFIILGQSLLLFALFRVWTARLGNSNNTAQSMLVLTLALVIGAVPLHLSRWGIPIVWALEGTLLAYVGSKFRSTWTRSMGVLALFLAAGGLLKRMPLHYTEFNPVFNVAFGSWLLVGVCALVASRLLWKMNSPDAPGRDVATGFSFSLGFALVWLLLSLEVAFFWGRNYKGPWHASYMFGSETVLWSVLTCLTVTTLYRLRMLFGKWEMLSIVLAVATGMVFLASLTAYEGGSNRLFVNAVFLPRLVYAGALWYLAAIFLRTQSQTWRNIFEAGGFIVLAILFAAEFVRWSHVSKIVSQHLAFSLLSAAWAVEAFGLIWYGLATRHKFRRILGFVLFAIVVVKVLLVDTSELEKVYRIVSFGATGILLLAAGYFFQRYNATLLHDDQPLSEVPGELHAE